MKTKLFFIIVLLCAVAGTATTAQAAEKTVTYTFTAVQVQGHADWWKLTFTPSNSGFGSTGEKTVTLTNTTSSTGFTVMLDDGLQLTYHQNEGPMTFSTSSSGTGLRLNYPSDGGNASLAITSANYYVTHVKMAGTSGSALTGTATPWMAASGQLDQDVDMVTQNDALGSYRSFIATFSGAQIFGQLTVTYGDTPREYAITFNDVEDLSNPNPASYNVTTSAFLITAPSRTGYTLGTVTYTDALHTTATPVNLSQTPMTINRGDAVERKAITFEASWTANTYTVHYDANGGEGSMDDQALTYDEGALAANAFTAPTDYVFNGWNTEDDGSGTAYTDQQAAPNVSPDDGATVTLYAQWRPVAGSCGDNARWSYDDDGTLSITGTGGTYNFSSGSRPWEQYRDAITTVSIGDGITSIGSSAFSHCSNLANISGGSDLIFVKSNAFDDTQWWNTAAYNNKVNYIGRIAYICGTGVSGDVTLADGTIAIAEYAFRDNWTITSVTIPATVTSIGDHAFLSCYTLTTVNLLAATPPSLGYRAFCFDGPFYGSRTFNVRSADYKSAIEWADINNKMGYYNDYNDYNDFTMRVVSTLALPDGVTASADADDKVTAYGTTYYAEEASVTLSGCSPDVIDYGSFTMGTRYVVSYNDGEARTDRYIPDANGQATFTMPAADVEVSTESYVSVDNEIAYIDADGTEKTCTDFTVVSSDYEFGEWYGRATLGVDDATERWYVVGGTVNIYKPLSVNGNAHLILCDGAALRVNADKSSGAAFYGPVYPLTIYGQAQGTGTLSVTNTGISINVQHDITINGGNVIATSTGNSKGIDFSTGRTLTINGGTVTATGSIGINIIQATLTQNGGTLTAMGSGSYYAGIYADGGSKVSTVNILGGILNATGTDGAYGIRASNNAAVTLGWTNAADRITATSYYTYNGATISVKSGQTLYDGTTTYSGSLDADQLGALAGKTLMGVDILLDDDSAQPAGSKNADRIAALAADGKQHNVMLQGRTLYRDGDWNTLCLPFTVKGFDIRNNADNPLHGCTAMQFNTYNWYDSNGTAYNFDGDQYRYESSYSIADPQPDPATLHRSGQVENGSLYLYFYEIYNPTGNNNSLWAGNPYIVKWGTKNDHPTTHIVNPVFQGVTGTGTIPIDRSTAEGYDAQTDLGNVTIRGTFAPKDYAAADHSILFLGEGNTLYYPEAGAHIGPFRAYFELGNGLTVGDPASAVRAFSLSFADGGEDTGIISLSKESGNQGNNPEFLNSLDYYTLDGVRLNGQPTRKGLYIHNGKKVVVP